MASKAVKNMWSGRRPDGGLYGYLEFVGTLYPYPGGLGECLAVESKVRSIKVMIEPQSCQDRRVLILEAQTTISLCRMVFPLKNSIWLLFVLLDMWMW